MHLLMLVTAVALAYYLRSTTQLSDGTWNARWPYALQLFVVPPLLVVTTALAVVWMGPEGNTFFEWDGWLSHGLALGGLAGFALLGAQLSWEAVQGWWAVQALPRSRVLDVPCRLLASSTPFVAQVGFWNSELVVSQGLRERLTAEQLDLVLAHEAAHAHYRDTFWFFWLQWLALPWLPMTERLWQELLCLRELRADRWAAERGDRLILAEVLIQMAQWGMAVPIATASVFATAQTVEQRVEALLYPSELNPATGGGLWFLLIPVPLGVIPLHLYLCLSCH